MSDKIKRGYHYVYRIHYHFVFPAKHRKALLNKDIEQYFLDVCKGIQERYEIEFEQIGLDKGPVHVLCSVASKYSPARIISMIKSITARRIFKKFPMVEKRIMGRRVMNRWVLCGDSGREGQYRCI